MDQLQHVGSGDLLHTVYQIFNGGIEEPKIEMVMLLMHLLLPQRMLRSIQISLLDLRKIIFDRRCKVTVRAGIEYRHIIILAGGVDVLRMMNSRVVTHNHCAPPPICVL